MENNGTFDRSSGLGGVVAHFNRDMGVSHDTVVGFLTYCGAGLGILL